MTLHPDILDLSPIDPPRHEKEPQGRQVAFNDIVSAAGMLNVVTLPTPPDIRLHDGTGDFLVPRLGCPVYCISEAELPTGSRERSREIMRRLAYGFFLTMPPEKLSRAIIETLSGLRPLTPCLTPVKRAGKKTPRAICRTPTGPKKNGGLSQPPCQPTLKT